MCGDNAGNDNNKAPVARRFVFWTRRGQKLESPSPSRSKSRPAGQSRGDGERHGEWQSNQADGDAGDHVMPKLMRL